MNSRFVLVSAVIFGINYFFAVLFPFVLEVNIFIVWALTAIFFSTKYKLSPSLIIATTIFFDFWSGGPFGTFTFALVLTMLLMAILKKFLLTENRHVLVSVIWLIVFYYLYLCFHSLLYVFIQWPQTAFSSKFMDLVLPSLKVVSLLQIFLWIILMMFIMGYEKRVSRF